MEGRVGVEKMGCKVAKSSSSSSSLAKTCWTRRFVSASDRRGMIGLSLVSCLFLLDTHKDLLSHGRG
jgi:hypothetical protein